MKIAYISGRYRARNIFGVALNIWRARRVALHYWRQGYAVICPHMNTAFFPEHDVDWIAGDLEFIKRLKPRYDIMVMLPGWEKSAGARLERLQAVESGIEVIEYGKR